MVHTIYISTQTEIKMKLDDPIYATTRNDINVNATCDGLKKLVHSETDKNNFLKIKSIFHMSF